MKMTAELSVYPLREDFKTAVLGFIDELLKGQDVVAVTNSMSTQINGEDEAVFSAIQQALRASYAKRRRRTFLERPPPGDRESAGEPAQRGPAPVRSHPVLLLLCALPPLPRAQEVQVCLPVRMRARVCGAHRSAGGGRTCGCL